MKEKSLNPVLFNLALLVLIATPSCDFHGRLRGLSSASLACSPKDIEIVDDSGSRGLVTVMTWTAKCDGITYYCTQAPKAAPHCSPKKSSLSNHRK